MRADELLELAALDAAGALAVEEQATLARALRDADETTRRDVAGLYDTAAGLADEDDSTPSAGVRDRIMAYAAATRDRFRFVLAGDGWRPHPIPGVRYKALAVDEARGTATLLLQVQPGTVYPSHRHTGAEECYVLEGDVTVHGRRLGPGDFHHADAGTDHEPLSTEGGATVLLVVALADYRA